VRLTGLTSTGRTIALVAQVDRLPLALVDIAADAAAPSVGDSAA
jgi:hypothetical protein